MARLTQQQVESWIAANGGANAVQYSVEQKQVRNPDVTSPDPFTTIEVEVWRAYDPRTGKPTGAELTARRMPEGDFEQIENKSAAPTGQSQDAAPPGGKPYIDDGPEAGPSGRRWGWNPQTRAYDRDLGPSPSAQKPPEPTSTEKREPVATHPGYTQVTTTNKQTGKAEVYYLDPNGNRVNSLPEKPTTAALVGSPTGNTRTRTEKGQTIKETEYVLPNGQKEWRTQTAPSDDKDAFGVEPEGAPDVPMVVGQVTVGLRAYSTWLSGQVKLHRDTNGAQGVSPREATKLMERRIALAEAAVKEQTDIVNTQSQQRGQDITQRGQTIGEVQNRRGTSERVLADINRRGDDRLKYLLPENAADHIAARQEEMRNAILYAQQWGGLRDVPEIAAGGFPALQQLRQASLAGIQTAAQGGPRIFDQRTTGAPGAAPAAGVTPAFRPPPPVAGSVAPPVAAAAAPMVPPAVNPINQQPIVLPTQLPEATPMGGPPPPTGAPGFTGGPTAGEPGGPPLAPGPVWMPPNPAIVAPFQDEQTMPGYVSPNQYQPAAPVNMDPSQGPVGMSPRFMQEARYGEGNYYDPDLSGAQLSAELGIDPEIMKLAISSLYG